MLLDSGRDKGSLEQTTRIVTLAMGLGCLLAFCRALAPNFTSQMAYSNAPDAGAVYVTCEVARVAAIILLMLLHWRGARLPEDAVRPAFGVLGVLGAGGALALSLGVTGTAAFAAAVAAGIAGGAGILAYLVLLAGRPYRVIVASSLVALLVFGLLLMGLRSSNAALASVLLVVCAVGFVLCLWRVVVLLAERNATRGDVAAGGEGAESPSPEDETIRGAGLTWFPALMFAASGIIASILFGVSLELGWDRSGQVNFPLFGVTVVVLLVLSCYLVASGGFALRASWLPLFSVLLCALLLSCFADQGMNPVVTALLLAAVFGYNFLRWTALPAYVHAAGVPRVVACGIILLLTSSFLNVSTGKAIAHALPAGLQLQGGLVAAIALTFMVVFMAAFIVERAHGVKLMQQAPQDFAAALDKAVSEVLTQAQAEAESRACAEEHPHPEAESRARAETHSHPEPATLPRVEGHSHLEIPVPAEPRLEVSLQRTLEDRCVKLAADYSLTPREAEILLLTARGHSSTYIAKQLVISSSTVRFHHKNIYRKLDIHDRQALLALVSS